MSKRLREYQATMAWYIINNPYCALFVPMGMGKTAATLAAIDMADMIGLYADPVLIVAPLRVAKSTWPSEITDPSWPQFNHIKFSVICGTPKQKQRALNRKVKIYITNYESLPWLQEQLGDKWPFGWIIADESTKLKGFRTRQGTQRAKILGKQRLCCERFTQLTGTPAPNGLKDIWACGWFIDLGLRLGRTYTAFTQRWFRKDFTGFNWEALPHAQDEIEKALSDVCLSLDAKDYFDIQAPIENTIYVELPVQAAKAYKEMERHFFTEIEQSFEGKTTLEAQNAAAKSLKCLQIANGAAYQGENGSWVEVHQEKLHALEEVVEEASGMPVLVVYYFKSDLERLKKHFPQGKDLDTKEETITQWNEGKIPLLFVHPASAGHGLSLQHGGNIICFFSLTWNLEHYQQVIERIGPTRQLQSGYDRPVFIHYIQAKGTIEDVVRERLSTKKTVQELLMRAVKEHKERDTC